LPPAGNRTNTNSIAVLTFQFLAPLANFPHIKAALLSCVDDTGFFVFRYRPAEDCTRE